MRPIVRAPLLAAALLLGIPGGALVLARLGFIELPPDTYVSSVAPSGADAAGSGTGLRVLERLDTMPTQRAHMARIAILAADELLPGHDPAIDRAWTFHHVSRPGPSTATGPDVGASVVLPNCAECSRPSPVR